MSLKTNSDAKNTDKTQEKTYQNKRIKISVTRLNFRRIGELENHTARMTD